MRFSQKFYHEIEREKKKINIAGATLWRCCVLIARPSPGWAPNLAKLDLWKNSLLTSTYRTNIWLKGIVPRYFRL
jgi:hypothetical protein